ncbi:MAG: tetratricopeptide repeat protein [Maribacter sp.]|nr:tetratricopeptide repeat protein [Maribacter sp.]
MSLSFEEQINNGNIFLQENELEKSIGHYEDALKLAATTKQKIDLHNVLGRLYQKTRNPKKAITTFSTSLKLYEDFPKNDILSDKASIFNNLAAVYLETDFYLAIENYKQALKIYSTITELGNKEFYPHLANTNFALAEAFSKKTEFYNAKKYFKAAITLYGRLPNHSANELKARALYHLGNIYTEEFNLFDAKVNYAKALALFQDLSLKDEKAFTPFLAAVFNNLGVTYKSMGEHKKALGNYEQALKLYQNLADNNELFLPYVAATINSLSILYAELKNYERAIEYGHRTIDIYNRLVDSNPGEYTHYLATSLHNSGLFGFELRKLDLAEEYFDQALTIRRSLALKQPDAFDADFCATALNLVELYQTKMESKVDLNLKAKCLELLNDVDGRLQKQDENRPVLKSMKSNCRYYLDYFNGVDIK